MGFLQVKAFFQNNKHDKLVKAYSCTPCLESNWEQYVYFFHKTITLRVWPKKGKFEYSSQILHLLSVFYNTSSLHEAYKSLGNASSL